MFIKSQIFFSNKLLVTFCLIYDLISPPFRSASWSEILHLLSYYLSMH